MRHGCTRRPERRGRVIIALVLGSGVSGVLAVGAATATLLSLAQKDELPSWFPAKGTLATILAGVLMYEAALSAVGATVSVAPARRKRAASDE